MTNESHPAVTRHLARTRRDLAPGAAAAFHDFGQAVFAEGALPTNIKHIIAVAVAHVTQCSYCIRGHTRAALLEGATRQELMEAIWVAAEMRAGGAFAHSIIAVAEMETSTGRRADEHPDSSHSLREHHAG